MMLQAFIGINLVIVSSGGIDYHSVSPLTAVQLRILALLGCSTTIYQDLAAQSGEVAGKMSEP